MPKQDQITSLLQEAWVLSRRVESKGTDEVKTEFLERLDRCVSEEEGKR